MLLPKSLERELLLATDISGMNGSRRPELSLLRMFAVGIGQFSFRLIVCILPALLAACSSMDGSYSAQPTVSWQGMDSSSSRLPVHSMKIITFNVPNGSVNEAYAR